MFNVDMVDSCGYKSRVIKGAHAIFADWRVYARFDPGVASDGYGSIGRPCCLIFTLPQMQAPRPAALAPAGALPGSTIFAQVPQAPGPVQGAVVQAVQAVPGGVELCAKQ